MAPTREGYTFAGWTYDSRVPIPSTSASRWSAAATTLPCSLSGPRTMELTLTRTRTSRMSLLRQRWRILRR
ncbi:MAG: hypothetical protein ACLU37_09600 [Collinsella sp.]